MKTPVSFSTEDLSGMAPHHDYLVGVDSDGCVFDTMERKQKECFHPLIISHWRLEPVADLVRETAEFINLYSIYRGQNRFRGLILTFDLLRERPGVKQAGVSVPELRDLREFVDSDKPPGNPGLESHAGETGSQELRSVLEWSIKVNAAIERSINSVPPFDGARKALKIISDRADSICVSQTPAEALVREWTNNDILNLVRVIAGQEMGSKSEHLRLASRDRYAPGRILMIGDAPGDFRAAMDNAALFYPINPGRETESWERFVDESFQKFLDGNYSQEYQKSLTDEFFSFLPETPPWKRT